MISHTIDNWNFDSSDPCVGACAAGSSHSMAINRLPAAGNPPSASSVDPACLLLWLLCCRPGGQRTSVRSIAGFLNYSRRNGEKKRGAECIATWNRPYNFAREIPWSHLIFSFASNWNIWSGIDDRHPWHHKAAACSDEWLMNQKLTSSSSFLSWFIPL